MTRHTLYLGRRVAVINRELDTGRYYVAGRGFICGHVPCSDQVMVRFVGERFGRPRFVELAAQDDPQGYCDALNARQGVPA